MTHAPVHAPGAPAPVGPYSHAVASRGELVHLSGQTPIDPGTGRLVEATSRRRSSRSSRTWGRCSPRPG